MISRYNRTDFLKTESVDGVEEKDLLSSTYNEYKFKRPMVNYRLQYEDYCRPDIISLKAYGTQDYWWVVLKCNPQIEDIWNDFVVSNEAISVSASQLDPSIKNDYMVLVDKAEYTYPDAYRVGYLISIPDPLDLQDMYTNTKTILK